MCLFLSQTHIINLNNNMLSILSQYFPVYFSFYMAEILQCVYGSVDLELDLIKNVKHRPTIVYRPHITVSPNLMFKRSV